MDSPGDNILAEFHAATDAVRTALAIQRVIPARGADLPENRRMHYRVGVHLGEVRIERPAPLG